MGKRLKKLFSRLLHLSSSTSSFFFKHVIMNICKETCSHLETANIARKLVLMLAKIIFGFYVNNTRSEKNLHCRTSTLANTKSVTVIIQPLIILCTRQLHIPWSLVLLQLLALLINCGLTQPWCHSTSAKTHHDDAAAWHSSVYLANGVMCQAEFLSLLVLFFLCCCLQQPVCLHDQD